jgi:hypothetical protein
LLAIAANPLMGRVIGRAVAVTKGAVNAALRPRAATGVEIKHLNAVAREAGSSRFLISGA